MSFFTSLSGLKAAQTDLNVISNNVANTNSTSFKKSRAQFGDLFAASNLRRALCSQPTKHWIWQSPATVFSP